MKIAQLVSNQYTISPGVNHAIYSHVAWLVNGLKKLDQEVTLYAAGDSDVETELVSVYPTALNKDDNLTEAIKKYYTDLLISRCYQAAEEPGKFDLIHSHFTLISNFYSALVAVPTVHTVHSPINPAIRPLLKEFPDDYYISLSYAQRRQVPELNWVANIYHGVDTDLFDFNPKPDDYFLYLGRITEDKGVHLAIEAAKAAGVSLIIAGRSYQDEGYWHKKIEKNIDGKNIKYIGEADFQTKVKYLRQAKAVLFPAQWDEPFGYVMIEAMSCGTPVIAWRNGSVPEVVADGRSGYIVDSVDGMVKAINAIEKISRQGTRLRAETLFSVEKMVSGYLKVYARIIDEYKRKQK